MADRDRFGAARRSARRGRLLAGLAVLATAALVAGAGWLLGWSTLVTVTAVDVEGGSEQVREEVRAAVQRSGAAADGIPLARVDAGSVTRAAQSVRAVETADVVRSWPHRLVVRVVERTPRAVLQAPDGFHLIGVDGTDFATRPAPPAHLPLLVGSPGPAGVEARAASVAALASLPASLAGTVRSVHAGSPDDIELHLAGGVTVVWGDSSRPELKTRVLTALLPQKARVYDVSAPELPTIRPAGARG